jgi:alkanesulfonate monooxygenase SsuD/methylene tetrahydromethanopterin reductase-like flavin-dependent oxidoreductase (luciferase family)
LKPIMLRYDLRAPSHLGSVPDRIYEAALEQCTWADGIPEFTSVVLSEHHGVPDGYCPSPIVVAGAVAARTSRIGLMIAAIVLPLHDPLRVAEDLAVLDILSRGRAVVVFVAGYRPSEFAMFGRAMAGRGQRFEEAVDQVRAAWRGEPLARAGGSTVTPRTYTPGGPPLLLGGSSVATARRAARLADGFLAGAPDPALGAAYREERARLGLGEGYVGRADGPNAVFVAEDPDALWARIAPHVLHETNSYAEWESARPGAHVYEPAGDADELRRSGRYLVLTPDECVQLYRDLPDDGGLMFHPLVGGLAPDVGWSSLELFAARVLPRLRAEPGPDGG